jgi:hypothetical protein
MAYSIVDFQERERHMLKVWIKEAEKLKEGDR